MLYKSMLTITAATTIVTIFLAWLGSLRNPFRSIYLLVRELWISRLFLYLFLGMIGILIINKYELSLEKMINTPYDYTGWVFGIEGQLIKAIQDTFNHPYLTEYVVFFYIIVFQSVLIASLAIYLLDNNKHLVYATCIAIMLNYGIAIPFYLFVPVHEVWSYAPAQTKFLMLDVFPAFEEEYRPFSGIDNCFPSLHTSISLTMMLLSYRSGNKRWMIITTISACSIIFGIFYLGIHWLLDMLAGAALALIASTLGLYLANATRRTRISAPVTINQ